MLLGEFGPIGLPHFQELARQQDASAPIDVEFTPVSETTKTELEPETDEADDWLDD